MFRRGEQEERDKPIEAREVRMSEGASTEVTVVGQGARLEGTVLSAGSLRIDGQVKGKITADGDVTLSAQSQVEADISATNVTIAGKFKGNITAKTLVVSEGATFNGQSLMDQSATGVAATTSSSESTKADATTRIEEPAKAR